MDTNKKSSQYWDDFCDPDRIQTCNLLIRSQMLYSVEPRDHFLNAMQRYAYFLIQQNFFGFFYQIVLILLNIAFIMQKRWFKTIKDDDLFALFARQWNACCVECGFMEYYKLMILYHLLYICFLYKIMLKVFFLLF